MKIGVVLTRAQPIHKGHISIIQQALSENDQILIVIGSANKQYTKRNPFSIEYRVQMVKNELEHNRLSYERVKITTLDDWSMENAYQYAKEWGNFFYYNVVNQIHTKAFTLYYNDDVDTVYNWFTEQIKERITIKNTNRIDNVSSTNVRNALMSDDIHYLKSVLCPANFNVIKYLKDTLMKAMNDDFIMN